MNYWSVIKYLLMTMFLVILVVGAVFFAADSADTTIPNRAHSQMQQQPNQPKFNF